MKRAKGEMYRELILDAAERVFAEHGFVDAKMHDVATRAGVSSSTVYATFEGKEALHTAVHERRGTELLSVVARRATARAEPLSRLLGGVAAYVGYLIDHPTYLRILGHAKVWSDSKALPSEAQTSASLRGSSWVSRTFSDGIAAGVFQSDDPGVMTRVMHAVHQVRLIDWLERGMDEAKHRVVWRLQRELVCMFCHPDQVLSRLAEHGLAVPPESVAEQVVEGGV